MLGWLHGEGCGVALDGRHDPVVITTWYGAPNCEVIDAYFAWSDAQMAATMAAEQRLVHIADLRHARMPRPLVCKRVTEHAVANLGIGLRIASIVVTGEPALGSLVRVAARPLSCLRPRRHAAEVIIVDRIDEAIERARVILREARIPPPLGLVPGRYRPPAGEHV